jgi:hypothetical protein
MNDQDRLLYFKAVEIAALIKGPCTETSEREIILEFNREYLPLASVIFRNIQDTMASEARS